LLKIARAAATDTDGEMTVALGLGWLYPVVVVALVAAGEVLALPFSLDPELELLVPEEVVTGGQDAFGLPPPLTRAVPAPPPAHHK